MSELRESIFTLDDKPKAAVTVRQWNNALVLIRTIEADERALFDKETARRAKKKIELRARERLLIMCCEDANGATLFKPDDEERLASKSNAAIDQLFRVACKHNGFTDSDDEDDSGNS